MAKVTLKEQLHNLTCQEERIKEAHLQEFFEKNLKPEKLFKIDYIGTIKEIELQGFYMGYIENGRNIYPPYVDKDKRTSSSLIEVYSNYIEKIQTAERLVYVNYKDFGSGAYKYKEVIPEKGISFNEIDLKEISEKRNELYAPRYGHTACCYCRKQTPNDELIESTIIGRGRKQTWNSWKNRYEYKACVTQEKLKFCSGQCAGNEQMSREG